MSNEGFTYSLPYSSVHPHRQALPVTQPGLFQSQNVSSSGPYYGSQTTVAAGTAYGAPEYQSQRYTQQRSTNSRASFSWYSSIVGNTDASQRTVDMGSDNTREEPPTPNSRPIGQPLYDGQSLGHYAYGSNASCPSSHGNMHERPAGTTNQGIYGGRLSTEDVNVRIPYQPYIRNFEQSLDGSMASSSLQQRIESRAPVHNASESRPYIPSSQPTMNNTTSTNSYSGVFSNMVADSNYVSSDGSKVDVVESSLRHQAQTSFVSHYGLEPNQAQSSQNFQGQKKPTPPPPAPVRKRQSATKATQRQKTKTPPALYSEKSTSSLDPNGPPNTQTLRANPPSDLTNPTYSAQPNPPSALVQRYNVPQGLQNYHTYSIAPDYQNASSDYHSKMEEDRASAISRDPPVALRPPSTQVPATVDPSHVYNRYHEYQKQIEAADAEHARLAALKAEREAAESAAAAAAALASAKSIQMKATARSQPENKRINEGDEQSQTPIRLFQEPIIPLDLMPTDQAANQTDLEAQSVTSDPPRQAVVIDPQKVAAMEDEMRLMVEKMREYQTRDPRLFAHVWESVKKKQIPRPMLAEISAGDHLIGKPVESKNKQPTSPVSSTAQQITRQPSRSESLEVTKTPAKPPRKRKSRSKKAVAERAVGTSQSLPAPELERVEVRMATLAAPHSHSNFGLQWTTQQGPVKTVQESRVHPGISAQPLSQHRATPNSAQRHVPKNSTSNQSSLTNSAQSHQTQAQATDDTRIDSILLKVSSETALAPVADLSGSATTIVPANLGGSPPPVTVGQISTGVLWPEEYRTAVSNAAAKVLNAIPENGGKKIAAFQILDMLGYNPSYIELCELIEGIGFRLDRGRFAAALLAAIPAANSPLAQPAESRVLPIPNKSRASKEYQQLERNLSSVIKESLRIEQTVSAHGQTPSLPVEATTPASASQGHSESVQVNLTRTSGGPGSRGPYRKTRERMSEEQNSSSIVEQRKGRRRSRKHGLPPMKGISKGSLDRDAPIDPRLAASRDHEGDVTAQNADQVPLNMPLNMPSNRQSDDIEGSRMLALIERAAHKQDRMSSSSNVVTVQPIDALADHASEPQPQSANNGMEAQPIRGGRSHELPAPKEGAVDGAHVNHATPLTKEMAARKRTFAEIIDLTLDEIPSSVEDHQLVPRKVRRVGDTNFESVEEYDGAQAPKVPNAALRHRSPLTSTSTNLRAPKHSQSLHPASSTLPVTPTVTPTVPNPYQDFGDIVKPIDRTIALRKSRYNPKTIARDILIATARHPFQRGLNAHLEPLKARFTGIDQSSDLSTFRWDIVDPGGPPFGLANMSAPTKEVPSKASVALSDSFSNPIVLGNIKLPVGRGPLKPTRGGGSTRGRGRPTPHSQRQTPARPSGLRFSSTVESNFSVMIESTAPERSPDSRIPRNDHSAATDSAPPAGRRGRHPKDLSAPGQHVTSWPKSIERPLKATSSAISTRGNSAGRKVGRSRIHPLSESKPTRRLRKSNPKPVAPKFIPFLCEWKDCKAELHNLETLRKHIYSVHDKAQDSGAIACRWSRCGLNRQVTEISSPNSTPKSTPEPKFVHEPHGFASMQEFKDHMERTHLEEFAWHMGDGPRGSTLDGNESDASAFFSDAAGGRTAIDVQFVEGGNARISTSTSAGRRLTRKKRPYDPALESPVPLATPGMRAKFFMGTEWKTIKAPPLEDRGFR